MSLTATDLEQIRTIISGELTSELAPIKSELKAIRNDIKEIYNMIAKLQSGFVTDPEFQKLSIEKKLLQLNAELLTAAKQAGITLPRS
jgi:hypothetical protein